MPVLSCTLVGEWLLFQARGLVDEVAVNGDGALKGATAIRWCPSVFTTQLWPLAPEPGVLCPRNHPRCFQCGWLLGHGTAKAQMSRRCGWAGKFAHGMCAPSWDRVVTVMLGRAGVKRRRR